MAQDFIIDSRFHNTELDVDLKIMTRRPGRMDNGQRLCGTLICDGEYHYAFREAALTTQSKRNPHVFVGKYITVTRCDDGSLRLNFRPMRMDKGFNILGYATEVGSELIRALYDLIKETEAA